MHTMLINKPPDVGGGSSRHPLHQDQWYFNFGPGDRIVAAWAALQDIDQRNGCLQVVPGSHKTELLLHGYPKDLVNKAYHGILGLNVEQLPLVDVPMQAGDVVFFHPLLFHGSGPNFSSISRRAISCHYAGTDFCKYIDVRGTMQDVLFDELKEMAVMIGKRKGLEFAREDLEGIPLSFMWEGRSRLVTGEKRLPLED